MRTILTISILAALPCSLLAERPPLQDAAPGKVDRIYINSPQLGREVTVDVWLPKGYDTASEHRYPVLYMHDGQHLYSPSHTWNGQTWDVDSVVGSLASQGMIDVPVVVGIHSTESRLGDLSPTKAYAYIPDLDSQLRLSFGDGVKLQGDEYVAFIADTLKPLIDSTYNVRRDADSTAVMGSSMGGLMSWYAMCERPDVFGAAACLSTHWTGGSNMNVTPGFPESLFRYLQERLPRDGRHRLYLDHGTGTIDAAYPPYDRKARQIAEDAGYVPYLNLLTFEVPGAKHEENAWRERLCIPVLFLFKK